VTKPKHDLMPAGVSDGFNWRLPWADQGACLNSDLPSDAWFPISHAPEAGADARAVCNRCPVKTTCLGQAMLSAHTVGIWGGTDERQRKQAMRRERRHA
jgi:WhiB family redox-sensing transcriptional regulator